MLVIRRVTLSRLVLLFLSNALFVIFGPMMGKSCLHALTPASTLTAWQGEAERLDRIFPRDSMNEAKRLELLRKLRQRGIRIDEGIVEEIDHHITPYTIAVKIGWQWQELFGLR